MERGATHSQPLRPVVLMVENDEATRAEYAYALSAMGFDVMVEDGSIARGIPDVRPDIIVAEVDLEGDDGWSRVRGLKRDPRTRNAPIVVVTDDDTPPIRERASREGCVALCLKPCPPDRLAIGLRVLLERTHR